MPRNFVWVFDSYILPMLKYKHIRFYFPVVLFHLILKEDLFFLHLCFQMQSRKQCGKNDRAYQIVQFNIVTADEFLIHSTVKKI